MTGGAAEKASRRGSESPVRIERRIDAARGYLTLEKPEHALRELAGAAGSLRHRFDVSRLRGDAMRLLGRYGDAVGLYTRALAERPDALPVLMGLASCYRHLGQLSRATVAVEEANRLHPNEPAVLFAMSRFYALAGETERAFGWLGRAARICPDIAGWADRDADFAAVKAIPHFQWLLEAARIRQSPE